MYDHHTDHDHRHDAGGNPPHAQGFASTDTDDPGNLYPCDLELTVRALDAVQGGVLVQLSTYSTQDGNSQEAVVSSVNAILAKGRLRPTTVVRLDGRMMSLVCAREIDWLAELADLPRRFRAWLDRSLLVERPLRSDTGRALHGERGGASTRRPSTPSTEPSNREFGFSSIFIDLNVLPFLLNRALVRGFARSMLNEFQ